MISMSMTSCFHALAMAWIYTYAMREVPLLKTHNMKCGLAVSTNSKREIMSLH